MLFSSSAFWLFYLFIIFLLQVNYKLIKSINVQATLLLAASYFFYAYWDWRFLGLIFIVSIQTYVAGLAISCCKFRKFILAVSVLINLSILFYFKYAGFFVYEFMAAFELNHDFSLENIILPVGISFYIFQSFTYVVDVYFGKIRPEKDIFKYFAYISFFPQLVAGPIERASSLLPQFNSLKGVELENIYIGSKIIIIGLFFKVFIADSLAPTVDQIFSSYENYNGGTLILGAIGFAIQIYGDFAGYSFIAIGVAQVMGFSLMRNFNSPYFSTSMKEFWSRWHISLSTFFRDYVYIPLGGRSCTRLISSRNVMITFCVSGLWHGASWTYILWGIYHGMALTIERILPFNWHRTLGWIATMSCVLILWILFRSESLQDFHSYIHIMATAPGIPEYGRNIAIYAFYYLVLDVVLFKYAEKGRTWFSSIIIESLCLALMLILVIGTIHDASNNFIYFQF